MTHTSCLPMVPNYSWVRMGFIAMEEAKIVIFRHFMNNGRLTKVYENCKTGHPSEDIMGKRYLSRRVSKNTRPKHQIYLSWIQSPCIFYVHCRLELTTVNLYGLSDITGTQEIEENLKSWAKWCCVFQVQFPSQHMLTFSGFSFTPSYINPSGKGDPSPPHLCQLNRKKSSKTTCKWLVRVC